MRKDGTVFKHIAAIAGPDLRCQLEATTMGTPTSAVVHDYLGWCRDERGTEWASMASLSLATEDGTSVLVHKDVLGAVCKVGRAPPANLNWSLRPLLANRGVALRLKHKYSPAIPRTA